MSECDTPLIDYNSIPPDMIVPRYAISSKRVAIPGSERWCEFAEDYLPEYNIEFSIVNHENGHMFTKTFHSETWSEARTTHEKDELLGIYRDDEIEFSRCAVRPNDRILEKALHLHKFPPRDLMEVLDESGEQYDECDFQHYVEWEATVAMPLLQKMGYRVHGFRSTESDSFGPLSRTVSVTDKDGNRRQFYYG